jgi:hypothetical protein
MNEAVAADEDSHVPEAVEEDDVARHQIAACDGPALPPEHGAVMRKCDADPAIDVHDEAGAIEAGRTRAAPTVGNTQVVKADGNGLSGAPVSWRDEWLGLRIGGGSAGRSGSRGSYRRKGEQEDQHNEYEMKLKAHRKARAWAQG